MSDTPETQEAVERWRQGKINIFDEMARFERERDEANRELHKQLVRYDAMFDEAEKIRMERDAARNALRLIADDCEAWLAGESDEPSMEFIKLVAKYAREAAFA